MKSILRTRAAKKAERAALGKAFFLHKSWESAVMVTVPADTGFCIQDIKEEGERPKLVGPFYNGGTGFSSLFTG